MSCCVAGCSQVSQDDVKFFKFPASRTLRKRWIDAISPAFKISYNSMICSKHFNTYDYEEVRGNTRLKRNIIPSLFTAKNSSNKSSPSRDETPKSPHKPPTPTPNPDPDPKPPSSDQETQEKNDKATEDMKLECDIMERFASEMCEVVFGEENTVNNEGASEKNICIPLTDYAPPSPKLDTNKHDIEEILTNYHIKNNPDRQEELSAENIEDILTNYQIKNNPEVHRNRLSSPVDKLVGTDEIKSPVIDNCVNKSPVVDKRVDTEVGDSAKEIKDKVKEKTVEKDKSDSVKEGSRNAPPMFIEISVEADSNSPDSQDGDCLMLLENVQIELDPSEVMPSDTECIDMADDDDDDDVDDKKDPISLLTSSDEDDVIIEEPHIDTVEVSDETDEDDIPLVTLLKKQHRDRQYIRHDNANVRCGYEYYCVQCHFRTPDLLEYRKHVSGHTTVIEICQLCGYTTASKMMFLRHKRKHKDDKRFKCHLCHYKARHKIGLAYHLKTHNPSLVASGFVCNSYSKSDTVKRTVSGLKMYSCEMCSYETKRKSDLKRHVSRRHKEYLDLDDEEYVP